MEMEYRIDVGNKFSAFQSEDDGGEDIDPVEQILQLQDRLNKKAGQKAESGQGAKKAQSTSSSAKNDKTVKSSVPNTQGKQGKTPISAQDQKGRPAFGQGQTSSQQAKDTMTNRPPRFTNANRDVENREKKVEGSDSWTTEFRERPDRGEDSRGRGGFRRGGRGQGRGAGAAEGFDRFGKREFERHSGSDKSGFKPQEKREGGGAHNWGTVKDDIEEQASQELLESPEGPVTSGDDSGIEPKLDESAVEAAVEEKQLTLDEWKAQEEQRRVKASFNIRKPGEGCSDPKWKKMFVLKKKEEDEENEDEEYESDDQRLKAKNVVPIKITFNDAQRRGGRGGGDRGGRGGPRRGGQRDADNSDQPKPKSSPKEVPAPNVADELDFPSLG